MTQNKINPDPEGIYHFDNFFNISAILFVLLDLMVISKE
jgi:hypothetical protein